MARDDTPSRSLAIQRLMPRRSFGTAGRTRVTIPILRDGFVAASTRLSARSASIGPGFVAGASYTRSPGASAIGAWT